MEGKNSNIKGTSYKICSAFLYQQGNIDNSVELSFRVDSVYEHHKVCVYVDGVRKCISKQIMNYGDLENNNSCCLERCQDSKSITVTIEKNKAFSK